MKDLYAILNIGSGSSLEDIKTAYRKMAKANHPDKGGDPIRFHDIREAYETLCDPVSRHEYDLKRSRLPFAGEAFRVSHPHARPETVDIFDDIISVFGRGFGVEPVSRFEVEIILSQQEARDGVNLRLDIPAERICGACFGFGGTIFSDCRYCGGNGIIHSIKRIFVKIAPGANTGDLVAYRSDEIEISGRIKINR